MSQWHKIGILALVLQVVVLVQGSGGERDISNKWQRMGYYSIPPNDAIAAGIDSRGTQLFIARAEHDYGIFSARYSLTDGVAYIAYVPNDPHYGREYQKTDYELLVGDKNSFDWVNSSNGLRVPNAVPAGTDRNGESTYICRGFGIEGVGGILLGHMRYSTKNCIASDNGYVLELKAYQVLTKA